MFPQDWQQDNYRELMQTQRVELALRHYQQLSENGHAFQKACHAQAAENHSRWKQQSTSLEEPGMKISVCQGDWGDVTRFFSQKTGKIYPVLNMANASHVGGGYLGGAAAQEENIYRRTDVALHIHLDDIQTELVSDYLQTTPLWGLRLKYTKELKRQIDGKTKFACYEEQPFVCIREGEPQVRPPSLLAGYALSDPLNFFLFRELKSAALDLPNHARETWDALYNRPPTEEQNELIKVYEADLNKRIESQLMALIQNKERNIILSAFGCGAFGNPPQLVAKIYGELLTVYKNYFDEVIFAIYDTHGSQNYPFFKDQLEAATRNTSNIGFDAKIIPLGSTYFSSLKQSASAPSPSGSYASAPASAASASAGSPVTPMLFLPPPLASSFSESDKTLDLDLSPSAGAGAASNIISFPPPSQATRATEGGSSAASASAGSPVAPPPPPQLGQLCQSVKNVLALGPFIHKTQVLGFNKEGMTYDDLLPFPLLGGAYPNTWERVNSCQGAAQQPIKDAFNTEVLLIVKQQLKKLLRDSFRNIYDIRVEQVQGPGSIPDIVLLFPPTDIPKTQKQPHSVAATQISEQLLAYGITGAGGVKKNIYSHSDHPGGLNLEQIRLSPLNQEQLKAATPCPHQIGEAVSDSQVKANFIVTTQFAQNDIYRCKRCYMAYEVWREKISATRFPYF